MSYSINLPSYTIGTDAYSKINDICSKYGKKVVVIGGNKAREAAEDKIKKNIGNLELLGSYWYGGEASYENVERLSADENVRKADMLFAVGGGKATDTVKTLGNMLDKPVFTFPTIASNCSACTSVSIMYSKEGVFLKPHFFEKPPAHAFIDTQIIADSPVKYMWAGIGDTYAKYFESSVSSRNEKVPHYIRLGVNNSLTCYEPMMEYGKAAIESLKKHEATYEFEQVVLAIIVSTAVASILLCTDHVVHYNSGLAHAIFYSLTSYPVIEKNHLHGEVVAYGVLVLLLTDGDMENFKRVYEFNKSIGLPVKLSQLEIPADGIGELAKKAAVMKDIEHNPYVITAEMIKNSMKQLEDIN